MSITQYESNPVKIKILEKVETLKDSERSYMLNDINVRKTILSTGYYIRYPLSEPQQGSSCWRCLYKDERSPGKGIFRGKTDITQQKMLSIKYSLML